MQKNESMRPRQAWDVGGWGGRMDRVGGSEVRRLGAFQVGGIPSWGLAPGSRRRVSSCLLPAVLFELGSKALKA